jgi:hypothetical protein
MPIVGAQDASFRNSSLHVLTALHRHLCEIIHVDFTLPEPADKPNEIDHDPCLNNPRLRFMAATASYPTRRTCWSLISIVSPSTTLIEYQSTTPLVSSGGDFAGGGALSRAKMEDTHHDCCLVHWRLSPHFNADMYFGS